jgi:prolyl oligopeptidase
MKNIIIICSLILIIKSGSAQLNYPKTKTVEQSDDYFGTKVQDPYRWLENDRSEETKTWVKNQNKLTFSYLEKIPFRDKIPLKKEKIFFAFITMD